MKKQGQKRNQNALPVVILALGAVLILGGMGYTVWANERSTAPASTADANMDKASQADCTHSRVNPAITGLETVLCKSANHVVEGKQVTYESDPPLAGEHWPSWVMPGFYKAGQPQEKLVHSLEHGYVVIYYDESKLSAEQVQTLRSLVAKYTGQWDGLVAVPRKDGKYGAILTAWEHALRLEQWDQARVDAFVDAFRGRGPENPVRPI